MPAWVIEALVKHNIDWMRQLAPGTGTGRGAYARWVHQRKADWQHIVRYSEVVRARQRGLGITAAYH